MKEYRIKKEAVPFILEKFSTKIQSLESWNRLGIDIKALEEVEPMYVSYGIKRSESNTTLCGWDEKGSHFEFTIHFPSVTFYEHDKFSKGRITRDLMNKIQSQINNFYNDFIDEEAKTNPNEN